jgi:CHASE3 domain sensor protein
VIDDDRIQQAVRQQGAINVTYVVLAVLVAILLGALVAMRRRRA